MQRRTFLALTAGTFLSFGFGNKADAQTQKTQTAGPKVYTPKKPLEKPWRPSSPLTQRLASQRYSLIEDRPGLKLYSPTADEVHAVAFAEGIEWVGAMSDIKRVDCKRNLVRIYTSSDGVPPGVLQQLVADEKAAFAVIVTQERGRLLCCYDAIKDRFESFPLPPHKAAYSSFSSTSTGEDLLVLGPTLVAFVPWFNDSRKGGAPPFLVFDRKTRELTPGKWDLAVQFDHPELETRFATMTGETLWLGTQIGLLGAPLRTEELEPQWRRWLPARSVSCGTVLTPGVVAVATRERNRGDTALLETLALKTGKRGSLPSFPNASQPYQVLASSLVATRDGALWHLGPSQENGGFNPMAPLGPEVHCLAPGATQWQKVSWNDAPVGSLGMMRPPPTLADEKTLPDPVAAALVCRLRSNQPNMRGGRMMGNMMGMGTDQSQWLRQRFWRWQQPEHSTEIPLELLQPSVQPGRRGLRDVKDPGTVWLAERGGFVSVLRRDLPPAQNFATPNGVISVSPPLSRVDAPSAQHFPVSMAGARHRIRTRKLLGGETTLVMPASGSRLLRLSKEGVIPLDTKDDLLRFAGTEGAVAGPAKTCFVVGRSGGQSHTLWHWDEKQQALIDTEVAVDTRSALALGGTSKGLWRRGSESTLWFLAVGADGRPRGEWERVGLEFPPNRPTPNYLGAGADVLWFAARLPDGKQYLVIWNPQKSAWSESEAFDSSNLGFAFGFSPFGFGVVTSPDGIGWACTSSLLGYDPQNHRWENIALPKGKEAQTRSSGVLVAATRSALWVMRTDGTWRYDRAAKTWSKPDTAQTGFQADARFLSLPVACTSDAEGSWWLGTFEGLWRFDPEQGLWQEQTEEATVENTSLACTLVTENAVWGQSDTALAWLDRRSGKARLFGRESLEALGAFGSMSPRSGAGLCWFLGRQLAYFESQSQGFVSVPLPSLPEAAESFLTCVAVEGVPGQPQQALVAVNSASTGALYRWSAGALNPTPLAQPDGVRRFYDIRPVGSALFIAASDGLWRWEPSGRWEPLVRGESLNSLVGAMGFFRLIPDEKLPSVLWAFGGSGFSAVGGLVARIEGS